MVIPPPVAGPAIKATGQVTSALIGNYRPTGVPRTGSREDRAAAYRRLLDTSTRSFAYHYMNSHMNREGGWAGRQYVKGQLPLGWEISAEMMSALFGVRLCGTLPVITTAEAMVTAVGDMNFGEPDATVFQTAADDFVTAQRAFLNAARTDLAYDARWWQLGRRRAERKFLRTQQQGDAAALPAIEAP